MQIEKLQVLEDDTKKNQASKIKEEQDGGPQIEFGQPGYWDYQIKKLEQSYSQRLIDPQNKKLKYFHLIVSIVLFWDFFLTSFIIGNYKFYFDEKERTEGVFKNHVSNYQYICIIQSLDIILNFFKIEEMKQLVETPFKLGELYLKGNFVADVIAVIPYSAFNPYLLFFRYLKLLKFNTYLKYFEEFYAEILAYCLDIESIKIIMSMLKLLFQVIMVSHFFACFWVLIGQMDYEEY